MRITYSFTIFFLINTMALLFSSCGIFEDDIEYFPITVDSLYVPDSASVNSSIDAYVWGYIGPDGCHVISHFEHFQTSEGIALRVWGKHTGLAVCTAALEYLDNSFQFRVNKTGYYKVKILNPHNQYLLDSILIY